MKRILDYFLFSRIISVSSLFLWTFCEKRQRDFKIYKLVLPTIEILLFSWSLLYFLACCSLLKQYFQKRQLLKFTWWLSLQFMHLKLWGHSLLYLVSSLSGLFLKFSLQHQAKCQWYLTLCGLLYLMYFVPWEWQAKVVCFHFQQFLHCGIPGFMFIL